MEKYIEELEARFLSYVKIDTQSDEVSSTVPSTEKQYKLLRLLQLELQALGAKDVVLTDYACVLATIPGNIPHPERAPTVALLAHVDTAPAFSGAGVKPIVHRNYDGKPLILPDDESRVLSQELFPELQEKIGEDIVTASGTTLLGADDKAGIAIIMTVAAQCFTPDEEIGKGVAHLKLEDLGADVAYTLDGGPLGEVTGETFSADRALVKITGVATHPGTGKGILVNALTLAAKLVSALPEDTRTPETTEGREGFIHLYRIQGTAAEAELCFILRDFELDGLKSHGDLLRSVAESLQADEPRAKITCTIKHEYRNMRYWLENTPLPVELALEALAALKIKPLLRPIRGGTDGSGLTAKGLPTPNLFVGMHNCHGPLEWVSLQDMDQSAQVCIQLLQLWAQQKR
jgi:tripeptide aminopeptidase